jgi:hypothetical protein
VEELIARLEKATGPDRGLDRDIHREISKRLIADETVVAYIGPGGSTRTLTYAYPYHWALLLCPPYTSRIDAALKTLEPGWEFTISTLYGLADVELPLNDTRIGPVHVRNLACNVPAAICIAALKARAALSASDSEAK